MRYENIYIKELQHIDNLLKDDKAKLLSDSIVRSTLIDQIERQKKCEKYHFCISCKNETLYKLPIQPLFFCINCFWFGHEENVIIDNYDKNRCDLENYDMFEIESDLSLIEEEVTKKEKPFELSLKNIINEVQNYINISNIAFQLYDSELAGIYSIVLKPVKEEYYPSYCAMFNYYERNNYSYFKISLQLSRASHSKAITSNILFYKKLDKPLYFGNVKQKMEEDTKIYEKSLIGNEKVIINDFCKFIDFIKENEPSLIKTSI